MGSFARRPVALALVLPAAVITAATYGGCSADDESARAVDASADAVSSSDGDLPDVAIKTGCDADRGSDGLFQHLTCAGLYADFGAKRVAADARPYKPALELWADGAAKQRWISIPAGMKIDTSDVDAWVFPVGTKAWKEFRLDGKRVETRLYQKSESGGWVHTTYRWNDAETDAVRSDGGEKIARGGGAVPPYEVPNANQCNECHQGRKDRLLGFEPVSLGLEGAEGLTLAVLASEGLLSVAPPATTLAFPEDTTGKAASALAWMHVSCGPCHNRSSAATAEKSRVYTLSLASQLFAVDAGTTTVASLDAYTSTVGKTSSFEIPDAGGATFAFITPSDPAKSLVSYLSGRRVAAGGTPNVKEQMPPIVSRLVDDSGHALLDAWISALPP